MKAALEERENAHQISLSESAIDFSFKGERLALAQFHKDIVSQHEGVVSFYEKRLTIEDVFMAVGSRQVS